MSCQTASNIFHFFGFLRTGLVMLDSLLVAAGADVIEGKGSRVRFTKSGVIATFHRPHPKKEAKPYQVKDARLFLIQIGVVP